MLQEQSNPKRIEKGKAICTKMAEKEINKPSQVGEFQISLVTIDVMSRVGNEWEDIVDYIFVAIKTTRD